MCKLNISRQIFPRHQIQLTYEKKIKANLNESSRFQLIRTEKTTEKRLLTSSNRATIVCTPGAPLTCFNDGGVRQRFIFYTQKNPNFRICLPKKIPTFFSIPKKIPQCFCISKFYYLSSGKLKHANFNFGFGQKQNYKLRLCYC